MLPRLRKDKELSSSVVTMSTQSEQMMIASKPGYQLHAQFIHLQSLLITEDEDVNDMYTKIKESMTSCMTFKTVIMVTRTKLLFVADIHTNACTNIIYN